MNLPKISIIGVEFKLSCLNITCNSIHVKKLNCSNVTCSSINAWWINTKNIEVNILTANYHITAVNISENYLTQCCRLKLTGNIRTTICAARDISAHRVESDLVYTNDISHVTYLKVKETVIRNYM